MKHCLFKFGGIAALACVFQLLAVPTGATQSQPVLMPVKILVTPYLAYAPFFIGLEEGYFSEQGLKVEVETGLRAAASIPALAQGDIDVIAGVVHAGILNAMARGAKIKFVADKGNFSPGICSGAGLLVRNALLTGGSAAQPDFLRGRLVSVSQASASEYYLEKLLKGSGLSLDDLKLTDIQDGAVFMDALGKGSIDAVVAYEPWITRILEQGQASLYHPAEQVMPNFTVAAIVFGPSLLEKNPEAGRRFMVGYLKAVRQYNQGKTERNVEIISKHTGLDKETTRKACWLGIRDDGGIDTQGILDFEEWAMKKGFMDKVVPAEQLWDPSFTAQANKVLGLDVK